MIRIVMGCELDQGGESLGRRTFARHYDAMREAQKGDMFVFGAGLAPWLYPKQRKSMAELMATEAERAGFKTLVPRTLGWGSYAELEACLTALKEEFGPEFTGTLHSAASHLARCEDIVRELADQLGLTVRLTLRAAGPELTGAEQVRELVARVLLRFGIRTRGAPSKPDPVYLDRWCETLVRGTRNFID